MPATKVREFLDANDVRYVTIRHSPAYTAQEIAAAAHVRGKELAKTVVVKVDGRTAMAVIPASFRLDLDALRDEIGAVDVRLADELEFGSRFPGCEVGAMPPFGNLYGLDVYVAPELAEDVSIVFNAGTHTELIRLDYSEFVRLVEPRVVRLVQGAELAR